MTHGLMEDLNAAEAAAPHQRQPDQMLVASPFLPTLHQPRSVAPDCRAHGPGISKRLHSIRQDRAGRRPSRSFGPASPSGQTPQPATQGSGRRQAGHAQGFGGRLGNQRQLGAMEVVATKICLE